MYEKLHLYAYNTALVLELLSMFILTTVSSTSTAPISQQTAENQTLWTSLCETLILGVSLSWRSFHTGTRRHLLEYTGAVISTWIRQNSPKDRKTYIRQRLIWCKPNRYGHEGPCQPSTIRYENYSTTGSHPELTFRKVYYTVLWSNLPNFFQRRRFVRCLFLRPV